MADSVNKAELVDRLAARLDVTKKLAGEALEAIVDDETEFRPIGVGRTDRSGRFFVDYARVRVRQARAVIPGIPDPLLLHVTVEGLIAPAGS